MQIWKENGMQIFIKNQQELNYMRESGKILAEILSEVEKMITPGVSCMEINNMVESMMTEKNVIASFKGYNGFPKSICTNINNEVVHGIPTERKLNEGDIITVDCGVFHKGFHSDSAITVAVGEIDKESQNLINTVEKALKKGIESAQAGVRIGKIGKTIEEIVEKNGCSVVKDLVGHGIGQELHEDPVVPNFSDSDPGPILQVGMTIAIEPIITAGNEQIKLAKDKWTYLTKDGSFSAQSEHTIAITEKGPEILTKRAI